MKKLGNKALRFSVIPLAFLMLSAIVSANITHAQSGSATYQYLLGTGPLCSLAPDACPDIAMASNGDTVAINGSGTLSIHPNSVTGGGMFIHRDSSGNVKAMGTWTAVQLLSFNSYGTAPPFPANFVGGQALIRVHTSVGIDAILKVYCLIGSPPPGKAEGIQLTVQGVINFNKQVSGDTVFITA